ncbi:hypothetical protein ACEUZ9_000928 [Paracoccus litorisediminis]|uniref:hypothetical protein n=1 Tax=Paracoccus litorisediminis TaxID=2006130 RepID=UPI00372FEDA3
MAMKLRTRDKRKLAARILMSDLRKARKRGFWSDGNRVFRGEEIDEMIVKLGDRMINDTDARRPGIHRFANAMSALALIRRKPAIHSLPEGGPEMLVQRARNTYRGAIAQAPGSQEHFLLARRLARKIGGVGKDEMLLGREREFLERRFEHAHAALLKTGDMAYKDGALIPKGTRLIMVDDCDWRDAKGRRTDISARMLVGHADPVRIRKIEARMAAEIRDVEGLPEPMRF